METFEGLVEYSPAATLVADEAGTVRLANDQAAGLVGRDPVGHPLGEVFEATGAGSVDAVVAEVLAADGPRRFGWEPGVFATCGDDVPVALTLEAVEDAGDTWVTVTVTEVGARERRIRELREDEERYRQLLAASPAPNLIFDGDGEIVYANEAAADLFDVPDPDALVGTPAIDYVHPDEREDARSRAREALDEGEAVRSVERRYRTADGETRHGVASAVPLEYDGEPAILVVISDVTALKERERELERHNERLDRFASIVSHDLRNPLTVLRSSLELAERETGTEHVERALRAVDRMDELVSDLLTIAHHGETPAETAAVPVADVARAAWATVDTANASLALDVDRTVRADDARLQELFENLFSNAVRHAGPDVSVTVGSTDAGFYVADDGPGVPEADREQVFESGYSTAEEGTGYGLTIVREIADAHGWDVRLTESEAGGARFEIRCEN